MVGRWGMPPRNLGHERQFEAIGRRLLAVAGPGDIPLPPQKQKDEAIIVGQAFVTAWNAIKHNEIGVRKVAETLVRAEELYGDDVVQAPLARSASRRPRSTTRSRRRGPSSRGLM